MTDEALAKLREIPGVVDVRCKTVYVTVIVTAETDTVAREVEAALRRYAPWAAFYRIKPLDP